MRGEIPPSRCETNTESIEEITDKEHPIASIGMEMKNMRAVLITSLYNAPATIDNYYTAKVNHDLARERGG